MLCLETPPQSPLANCYMPQNFDNFMCMEKQELMRKITTHVCAQTCGTNDIVVHIGHDHAHMGHNVDPSEIEN